RPPPLDVFSVAWFDRWIKKIKNNIEKYGPVTSYRLGSGHYYRHTSWPPPGARSERLFLAKEKSGTAKSLNDGTLSDGAPVRSEKDSGLTNFLTGLCTRSTVQWTAGLVSPGAECEEDNTANEANAFTYTSAPFKSDRRISGPISVTLRGSTSAKDTTW